MTKKIDGNMTHQPYKQFNTYKEGLDLELLREYCMEHGEVRTFLRGETLEEAGESTQWVAYVERGCFKYMVHNDEEGKDYCTLVTCTPYGINTHRLLVRGHRIANDEEAIEVRVSADATQIDPIQVAPFIAAPILLILLFLLFFGGRKK